MKLIKVTSSTKVYQLEPGEKWEPVLPPDPAMSWHSASPTSRKVSSRVSANFCTLAWDIPKGETPPLDQTRWAQFLDSLWRMLRGLAHTFFLMHQEWGCPRCASASQRMANRDTLRRSLATIRQMEDNVEARAPWAQVRKWAARRCLTFWPAMGLRFTRGLQTAYLDMQLPAHKWALRHRMRVDAVIASFYEEDRQE